jgi:hypothetical protein
MCPHQIAGFGDDTVGAAYGVDSLQAVVAERVRGAVQAAEGGTLDWLGMSELGLTVAPVFGLGRACPHRMVELASCGGTCRALGRFAHEAANRRLYSSRGGH